MAEEKTIEINMSEDVQPETSFEVKQNEFVNREFMKAFRIKQGQTGPPDLTYPPNNFFDQFYLQKDIINGHTLWMYIAGEWVQFQSVI